MQKMARWVVFKKFKICWIGRYRTHLAIFYISKNLIPGSSNSQIITILHLRIFRNYSQRQSQESKQFKCPRTLVVTRVDVHFPQKRVAHLANKPKWTANKYSSTRCGPGIRVVRANARMPGHDPADARVNGRFSALKGLGGWKKRARVRIEHTCTGVMWRELKRRGCTSGRAWGI